MSWTQDARAAEARDDQPFAEVAEIPRMDFASAARGAPHYGAAGGTPVGFGTPTYDISTQRSLREQDLPPQPEHFANPWHSSLDDDVIEDPDNHPHEDCEESTYSGAMATVIKDLYWLVSDSKHPEARIVRITFAVLVALFLIASQVYVLFTIKTYVTSPAVRSIRDAYGSYQEAMYHGKVQDTGFGFSIGIGGPKGPFFDGSQFGGLSDDLKGAVCLIPFSQPGYLFIILFIWTLSVIGELRTCLKIGRWLWQVPVVPKIQDMITRVGGLDLIVGLPAAMKAAIAALIVLPRFCTSLVLLYLGSRWLTATLDFTEVLINAIALEFVIHMNALFYQQLVSDRSKRENANLKFDMSHKKSAPPTAQGFVGTAAWTFAALVWVYSYMNYLQMVIPDYQWDVRGPCKPWVEERFDFWRL